jgi:hypothetical protein
MKRWLLVSLLTLPLFGQSFINDDCYQFKIHLTAYDSQSSNDSVAARAQGAVDASTSLGYVVGVADALDGQAFCLPDGFRAGELKQVVIRYFDEHPTILHESKVRGIRAAFTAAYPCPAPSAH